MTTSNPIVLLTARITKSNKTRLKILCAKNNLSMNDLLEVLMDSFESQQGDISNED